MVAVIWKALSPVRWLVKLEIGIWRSLFLLLTRRISGQRQGVRPFSYSKAIAPVMGAFIFVSMVELPVVHLLIPWDTVRLVALVLSIWGLLWMVGLLASMKVFPHLLDEHGLRVRYGTTVDVRVPWETVASVTARRRSIPTRQRLQLDGDVVNVPVLKLTRVDVALRAPTPVELPDGVQEISELRLYVDDPRAFVAAAREQLAERAVLHGSGR
jgi:hypothetical protein